MAINASKVLTGGLAAGVVANVIGYLGFGLWLGPRMETEMAAVAPALMQGEEPAGGMIAVIVVQLVVGLLLVWLYAAIRPRFGPGMKTAFYAALVVWICSFLFHLDFLFSGLMSSATYALAAIVSMVQLVAAAGVGGMLYQEAG
jgi:hypothetical protein